MLTISPLGVQKFRCRRRLTPLRLHDAGPMLCSGQEWRRGYAVSFQRSALVSLFGLASVGVAHATDVAVCTDRGRAVLELADAQAPLHVANFLKYVDMGYYSGM